MAVISENGVVATGTPIYTATADCVVDLELINSGPSVLFFLAAHQTGGSEGIVDVFWLRHLKIYKKKNIPLKTGDELYVTKSEINSANLGIAVQYRVSGVAEPSAAE